MRERPEAERDADEPSAEDSSVDEWSVDEVARRAGTTVRNVRLYQERGLLPPPRRDGRRGWYNEDHLRRLRLVLSMLRRGYPLTAIRELTGRWTRWAWGRCGPSSWAPTATT